MTKRIVAMVLAACLGAGCGSGPRMRAWLVDPLLKVFPDDPPGAQEAAGQNTRIARNGHSSLQIAIRSAERIADLRVTAEVPEKMRAEVRRVGYVPVGSNPASTPYDEVIRQAPALYPDPLLEDFSFALPAQQTTPVWVTLYAPAETPAGEYRVRITLASGSRVMERLSVPIRVTRVTVPQRQTLQVTNWFNLDQEHLRRFYPKLSQDPDCYWELLANIGRVMADHRQNVMITPVFSLAKPSFEGGRIRYDFADLDRWVEVFQKAGVIGTIEGGHLLSRASGYQTPIVVPAYVVEKGRVVERQLDPGDPRAEQFLNAFLSALDAHLKEKGWHDRYIQHVHDEPHDHEAPVYNRYAQIIRRNLPGIPTIDAVSLQQDIRFFADVSDIWVPVLGSFDQLLPVIREHQAKGGQGWFYTCIGPQGRHLNRFIDYPLLKVRLLHWFNYRHHLTGFLHWGGNYWSPKPFANVQPVINDNTTLLPAGDNAIVYPDAAHNSLLSSIRLETMREGIEDYDLLAALAQRDKASADRLAAAAIPHVTDYLRDVKAFRKLQQELLEYGK